METGGGNAVPIYERIAREIFKGKSPTPFRIPPGMRLVKWPYENGTIDEVFKPGTEPGSGYNANALDASGAGSGMDGPGSLQAGGGRRPGLTGTGETY